MTMMCCSTTRCLGWRWANWATRRSSQWLWRAKAPSIAWNKRCTLRAIRLGPYRPGSGPMWYDSTQTAESRGSDSHHCPPRRDCLEFHLERAVPFPSRLSQASATPLSWLISNRRIRINRCVLGLAVHTTLAFACSITVFVT